MHHGNPRGPRPRPRPPPSLASVSETSGSWAAVPSARPALEHTVNRAVVWSPFAPPRERFLFPPPPASKAPLPTWAPTGVPPLPRAHFIPLGAAPQLPLTRGAQRSARAFGRRARRCRSLPPLAWGRPKPRARSVARHAEPLQALAQPSCCRRNQTGPPLRPFSVQDLLVAYSSPPPHQKKKECAMRAPSVCMPLALQYRFDCSSTRSDGFTRN